MIRPSGLVGVGEDGGNAAPGFLQAAIDRDDDVDDDLAPHRRWGVQGGQIVPDIDGRFGRKALGETGSEMVKQRIGSGVGMLAGIPDCIEIRMRIAQFAGSGLQVMQQRMDAAGTDVRIMRAVPGAIKERVGIASFG